MAFDQLLLTAAPWLGWSGLALGLLTVVAFLAGWGLRYRLVGVSSVTLVLSVSCWAFAVSYSPPVRIEGAVRVPVVFDNGEALVVAQAPADMPMSAVTPTLEQLQATCVAPAAAARSRCGCELCSRMERDAAGRYPRGNRCDFTRPHPMTKTKAIHVG